jgi:hypothetical protein
VGTAGGGVTSWAPPPGPAESLARAPDGGLLVGASLATSAQDVWAAGDCCTLDPGQQEPHWFQMRLWSQVGGGHGAGTGGGGVS